MVLYAVTFAVAARRLQNAGEPGCPCRTVAPSGSSYPTFTLAGETITYDNGELRVIPKTPNPGCSSQIPQPLFRSPLSCHGPLI